MSLINAKKLTFNDLMRFQKSEVINDLVGRVMSHQPLTWRHECQVTTIAMNDNGDIPATLPCEITPKVKRALETFNRAPEGFTLIDLMPSMDDAA